jgi:poly(A) polymerase
MIRKFINKLLGKGDTAPAPVKAEVPDIPQGIPQGKRMEVPASVHGIDPKLVDDHALRVVGTLQEAGHEAYIVGGAVRDLLLGLRPKDFDVATNATPEQVKALFRRAFIIGRRFRIVHVVFGRGREHEVIEVSTFRAYMDNQAAEQVEGNEKTSKTELAGKSHAVDASGRVLRDNVWGPQIEDAARRDFTVNAMYYDPKTQVVVDYHHGLKDSNARLLRMIGDPETRYREDPVRIIRVVRFAAKLGFQIEPKTQAPIKAMSSLLANVPASRMFDEMIKLLQTGHALASLEQLRIQRLNQGIFPILDVVLGDAKADDGRLNFVRLALADTDRRVNEGKTVVPSFMLACMLWHDVLEGWTRLRDQGEPASPALQQAIDQVFEARIGDISGRGKLAADMREIWMMQPRLERRQASAVFTLVEQPRFRAGFDFMRLRADAGEIGPELADWWEDFSLGDVAEREALVEQLRDASKSKRGPAHAGGAPPRSASARTKRSAPEDAGDLQGAAAEAGESGEGGEGADDAASAADTGPVKRKRRRRRKPASRAASDGTGPSEPGVAREPDAEG